MQLKDVRNTAKVKREDLPPEATLQAWHQLIQDLRVKVETNPEALYAVENYGTTWDAVWLGCLNDPHLSNLLSVSEGDVSLTEAKFRSILSNLLTLDSKPRESHCFSEQEEALIKTTMTIKNCPTGKNEAIDVIYGTLDSSHHYNVKLMNSDEERPIKFVTDVVQRVISHPFRTDNPPFLQMLIGCRSIPQAAHQLQYAKNLIGNEVGLEHELILDRTNIISRTLINKTRDEVLSAFFDYITPETLVSELIRAVNSDLRENSAIINPLVNSPEFWDEQDDLSYTLNEQGAIKLLQVTGFLTTDQSQNA